MTERIRNIRLFVAGDLAEGRVLGLSANQAHYLRHVMRCRDGDQILLFNGRDGEWCGRIDGFGKGWCSLSLAHRTRAQAQAPDLWLAFAPIKRARIDLLVQKATELGAAVLQPVLTRRTTVERVNLDRLAANAVEAAEQSERLSVPELRAPVALAGLLENWPGERRLLYCDEGGEAPPIAAALAASAPGAWCVLTGPEGGFAPEERDQLRSQTFVLPVSLGPRTLRAETAVIAALALWQAFLGDWHGGDKLSSGA